MSYEGDRQHLGVVADVLDGLSAASEVLEQTIIDQISGALYDVGVLLSAGSNNWKHFYILSLLRKGVWLYD